MNIKYVLFSALFLFGCLACQSEESIDEQRDTSSSAAPLKAIAKHSNSAPSTYDGFYLNTFNQEGVLIIFEGKIHHYNRNQFDSFYKDEEYDFKGINEAGFLEINTRYFLNRKNETMAKPTVLADIKPIVENGISVRLERNGRSFERLNTLSAYFQELGRFNLDGALLSLQEEDGIPAAHLTDVLHNDLFFQAKILTERALGEEQLLFSTLLRGLAELKN